MMRKLTIALLAASLLAACSKPQPAPRPSCSHRARWPQGPMSIEQYENFPVASWLCPPPLRPTVAALYGYARTAADQADEGDAPAAERLGELRAYREALELALAGAADPLAR